MSKKNWWVFIAVAAGIAILSSAVTYGVSRRGKGVLPGSTGGFATLLKSLLPGGARRLTDGKIEPGVVLRSKGDGYSLVARPEEAFEKPEKLVPEKTVFMPEGAFRDDLEWKGNVGLELPGFGDVAGFSGFLESEAVSRIETEVKGLHFCGLSEVELSEAGLKPDLAKQMGAGNGVFVVQKTLGADRVEYRFYSESGLLAKGKLDEQKAGVEADGSLKEVGEGLLRYGSLTFGFWDLVYYAGGTESEMTEEDAEEIADGLKAAGVEAKADGNRVVAAVRGDRARLVERFTKKTLERRIETRKLNAALEEARKNYRTLEENRAALEGQLKIMRKAADETRVLRDDLEKANTRINELKGLIEGRMNVLNEELRVRGKAAEIERIGKIESVEKE
ncbi:MAG: hypothetical protein JXP34_14470, partial [Planctomycetes bacterium]|nr:hypothetical protein [Planctomycetota bacterium]